MVRENEDGTKTPLTMPNHPQIKSSTLRSICTQAGISREEFLAAYQDI
ncbi:type II toxin-antitoxin system HicA family toxin [Anabaena sp. UHCC 0451]|nr:type II toxin-antitoxin system HicA family toxin [Anabaena sp. UHCC 0451]MEA5578897.1 type II toxin-antitoxin system HicA family toxin [Anabaena sp. UHCC 0451]